MTSAAGALPDISQTLRVTFLGAALLPELELLVVLELPQAASPAITTAAAAAVI